MRANVIERVVEDLRRYRVVFHGYGYQIIDRKSIGRWGGYGRVCGKDGKPRTFKNKGRAQQIADRLEHSFTAGDTP